MHAFWSRDLQMYVNAPSYIYVSKVATLHWTFIESLSFADDYYDTEDPSVNLHEFIVNSMQVCAVFDAYMSSTNSILQLFYV